MYHKKDMFTLLPETVAFLVCPATLDDANATPMALAAIWHGYYEVSIISHYDGGDTHH